MKKIIDFIGSLKVAILLVVVITVASIVATFYPQEKADDLVYKAVWFLALLGLFTLNLVVCTINKILRSSRFKAGFVLVHTGILLLLAGALAGGLWGEDGRMVIPVGEETSQFVTGTVESKLPADLTAGHPKRNRMIPIMQDLPFKVKLNRFEVIYYDYGHLYVTEKATGKKYVFAVDIEGKYEIPGSSRKLEILEFNPNFVMDIKTKKVEMRSLEPRNPAVRVRIGGEDARSFWCFNMPHEGMEGRSMGMGARDKDFDVRFAWMPRVKAYMSKLTVTTDGGEKIEHSLRVNHPFSHSGYTLYQTAYDTEWHRYSILSVKSDPGVMLVYAGFIAVVLGLMNVFYLKPLLARRKSKGK